MSALTALIGETLVDKEGKTTSVPDLLGQIGADGVLGLYFLVHWSADCRALTSELATFYKKFRETEKGRTMDIIFVSTDEDEKSFKEYLNDMPWKALPFSDRSRKMQGKLKKKFKVLEIPALVFIEADTGKLVTAKGREAVDNDPEGKEFPWHPKPFSEIIKGELLKGDSKVQSDEALAGKVKGFYFSAHWSLPCKAFTPELVKTYNKLKDAGKNFEIVFVSSDGTDEIFKEYYSTMPWLALPLKDDRTDQLSSHFEVEDLPMLVILDENNEMITAEGCDTVREDREGTKFPWHPAPVEELGMDNVWSLNDDACLFLFTHNDSNLQASATELMEDAAKAYKDAQKASIGSENELPALFFYYEGSSPESADIATSVREFMNLEGDEPVLALFDVPEERKYTLPAKDITKDTIGQVVEDFKAGKTQFRPLNGKISGIALREVGVVLSRKMKNFKHCC